MRLESAVFAGDGLFQIFGPGAMALDGTVLLTYGAFTDPSNVSVAVEDVTLSFPL